MDVTKDMGPLKIAPGTQWDAPDGFEHGMLPPNQAHTIGGFVMGEA